MKLFRALLIVTFAALYAQELKPIQSMSPWATNVKYFGLTYHPGGGSAGDNAYPFQLDEQGYWVLQLGTEIDLDYYFNDYFIVRSTVAVFKDCANVWSGHYHLGLRGNYSFDSGLSVRFGIGPTFIWRENWWEESLVNDWYNGDGFYGKQRQKGRFQTAFLWYGGNLEVDYEINDDFAMVYSLIPGYPQVFTSSFGLRKRF